MAQVQLQVAPLPPAHQVFASTPVFAMSDFFKPPSGELVATVASANDSNVAIPDTLVDADLDDDDMGMELAYPDDETLRNAQPPVPLNVASQPNPYPVGINTVQPQLQLQRRPPGRPITANVRAASALMPPPPVPPRRPATHSRPSLPVYTPVTVASARPATPLVHQSCPTPGCGGKAPAKGRRCFQCVRDSWLDHGKAMEEARVKAVLKAKQERLTIKLRLSTKKVVILDPKQEEEEKTVKPGEAGPSTSEDRNIDGWDSELSDLTDSETEVEEKPRPSFKIRIPARPPANPTSTVKQPTTPPPQTPESSLPTPPASAETPARFCTIARCRAPLPPLSQYRWKCCSPCRKHCREYQRERHARLTAEAVEAALNPAIEVPQPSVPAAELLLQAQKDWQREEKRRALAAVAGGALGDDAALRARKAHEILEREEKRLVAGEESNAVTWNVAPSAVPLKRMPAARLCKGRGCEHVIPSADEYEWKLCGVCRGRERRKAELGGKSSRKAKTELQKETERELALTDMPLAEAPKPGRCRYLDCGILLEGEESFAECGQCVRRKRRKPAKQPGHRNSYKPPPILKAVPIPKPVPVPAPAPKRKRASPYPPYQSCDALLADFGARFQGFIQAQSYYFLVRSSRSGYLQQESMFDFSGEYAVVAPDLNVVGRKSSIQKGAHAVKDAVSRAGGLEFSPTSWVSVLDGPGGVVTRFACVHLVHLGLLPPRTAGGHAYAPAGGPQPQTKNMQGELEIAVLPDNSHKYFPGERTIVRFRLVG
ncbi:hypothetical protein FB45DRAFT_925943 [Roridomyces roridus]|uniref:Uncharacterized protein n=1 Tax=Roridomyces roridus TaxID=1738132 RepID=A0AAD7FK41_9AGAR|nr:hypothetical protein FB45DRAFT_925943 [Roridomyces roridus]